MSARTATRGQKTSRTSAPRAAASRATSVPAVIHPGWVRVTHWINAIAMVTMIMSGWRIYNASPIWPGFQFADGLTIGGWLAGAIQWHFAAMWVLVVNGLIYLALGFRTGRFQRKFVPIRAGELASNVKDALTLRLSHDDISKYNAVQKLLYTGVIVAGIVVVASGLSIWKPVQLKWLTALFGGYDTARIVHFFAMAAICGFITVHVTLAIIVPRSLRAMVTGSAGEA